MGAPGGDRVSKRYVARDKTPATPMPLRPGPLTASQSSWAPGVGSIPAGPSVAPGASADADAACPGQCNAAWRRAEERWAATGEDHDVPFHPGRPVWCESVYTRHVDRTTVTTTQVHYGCGDRIADALTHIEQWIVDVPSSGALMMAAPFERHGTGSPPSPSPAFDERDAYERWLGDIAARLAGRVGHTQPDPGRRLAYVREWVTALLCGPDAEADGLAILSWERRLRAIVGAQTVTRMPGTCPSCDRRGTMRHRNGSPLIRCSACPIVIEWDDYHEQVIGVDDQAGANPATTTPPTRRTA